MRLLTLTFVTVMFGQPLGPYSGDWTADFRGTTFVRIALTDKAGVPQGEMSIGKNIHVDKQGNPDIVTEAAPTLTPMLDVQRTGEVLSFACKIGDDVDRFELRLIDTNTAELTLLLPEDVRRELAADGVPLPKPFRLAKSRN
jgi:hypothetical protein